MTQDPGWIIGWIFPERVNTGHCGPAKLNRKKLIME